MGSTGNEQSVAVGSDRHADPVAVVQVTEPYECGEAIVYLSQTKMAEAKLTYSMQGKLTFSRSGWLLLEVPNDLGNGAFQALHELGIEQPISETHGRYNAHISVMRPDEIAEIGGPDVIKERGKTLSFNTGRVREITNPTGWDDVAKCWIIEVSSPALMALRRAYGLGEPKHKFHITFAIKRRAKQAGLIRAAAVIKNRYCPGCGKRFGPDEPYPDAKNCEVCERYGPPRRKDAGLKEDIQSARDNTETPTSDAQASAGNYKKGKFRLHGLTIAIENPKGSTRSGTDATGKQWSIKMRHDYGYILGTTDRDEDHVDVFIGPYPETELVYVVDQQTPGGRFDEHKVLFGFRSEQEARDGYLSNYEDGWTGLRTITALTLPQFRWWLANGDTTKPVEKASIKVAMEFPA